MSTLSLYESFESNGKVSFKDLFDNKQFNEHIAETDINDIVKSIVRGGWPSMVSDEKKDNFQRNLDNYINSIEYFENNKLSKNNEIKTKILESISKNISTQIKVSNILKDIDNVISRNTLDNYISYLKDTYLIKEIDVWPSLNIQSKTRLLMKPKWYFCDPSHGLYILKINQNNIYENMNTFGIYFENLVIRDLKVYASSIGGSVYFYRDTNGFEIDCIIELNDGRWCAIEIKLGDSKFDIAAKNLLKLKERITYKEPSFLAIITATKYCYKRDDGVYIIPIQSLKN